MAAWPGLPGGRMRNSAGLLLTKGKMSLSFPFLYGSMQRFEPYQNKRDNSKNPIPSAVEDKRKAEWDQSTCKLYRNSNPNQRHN
ncbi:MAG: hypothetical protein M1423_06175, partial [Acidobacteria bacterium]|nr:hypothetical protein [Acidobacteriota bacterium]